jgi:hypothetical protein
MFARSLLIAALVLACGVAMAEDTQMRTLDKQQFAAYDTQVKTDIQQGNRYKEISPANQETVMKTLGRMEDRWQRADADGKLNVNDSVDMANDQEVVSTILSHAAADSRLICDRETPMGTLISKNVCRTVAQMKRDQNEAHEEMRTDIQRQAQAPQGH